MINCASEQLALALSNFQYYNFDLSALFQHHVMKRWSHAQFEHRLIVLSFTLLTVRDISFRTQSAAAATKMNPHC